ncbi:MAG TPA: hypothetical protein VL068_04175 [Microthrixaceae bacterium]|nr:hypothetical protein [Microthrixaceae bacterium]
MNSDSMPTPESQAPLALLEALIRRDPEAWLPLGDDALSSERVAELTEQVTDRVQRRAGAVRRRRRRGLAIGVAAVVLAGSGTAAALALFAQPDDPAAGVACRAGAASDSSAFVIEPGVDPIDSCRAAWEDGSMDELSSTGLAGRPLTACIGKGGAIEVFPSDETVCGRLGLVRAEPDLSSLNQDVIELQERLVTEVNEVDCVGVARAASISQRVLDDLSLTDWTVKIRASDPDGPCAKAAVMSAEREVVINEF